MIKEALQYIVKLAEPHTIQVNGKDYTYTKDNLEVIPKEELAEPIVFHTLQGIVDYFKSGIGAVEATSPQIIKIASPGRVLVLSTLNSDRRRENIASAEAHIRGFEFGRFINSEEFIIGLQSQFVHTGDFDKVARFAGTTESGTVSSYSDDGITQHSTVKKGITQKADELIPNPVVLAPYRTFTEVEQPKSEFVFRMMSSGSNGVSCALIEADGGAWERQAMNNIKEYFEKELPEMVSNHMIIVIS